MTPKLFVGGVPAEETVVVLLKDCGYDHPATAQSSEPDKPKKQKWGYKGASKKMQKTVDAGGVQELVPTSKPTVVEFLEETVVPKLEVIRVAKLEEGEDTLDVANLSLDQKLREVALAEQATKEKEVVLTKVAEPQTVKVELAPIVLTPNIHVTMPAVTINLDLAKTVKKTQEMERNPDGLLTKVVTIEEPVATEPIPA